MSTQDDEEFALPGEEAEGEVAVAQAPAPVAVASPPVIPTSEALKRPAATPAYVPPAIRWPKPRKAGEVVFETWGGYGAQCPDCGFTFNAPTPEGAREAVTYRQDTHGAKYCRERAAGLSEKERASLAQLYAEPAAAAAPKKGGGKGTKPAAKEAK